MKKLLLISFGLLLAINYGLSQPQEYQWLIWNGNGKYGTSTPTTPPFTPYNNYTTTITNQFNLNGVLSPTAGQSPAHKNDLLIIYSNYQHYNSRISSPTGVFFNGTSGPTVSSHDFNTPTGTSVRYMYLTKRYEGDELPTNVRLSSTAGSGAYSVGTTTPGLLSANHDVVFGKDITLIINYGSIKQNFPGEGSITLDFAGIRPHAGGSIIPNQDFLDLKPVFGDNLSNLKTAVYPNPSVDPETGNYITLQPDTTSYRYVNLKPNVNINNFPTGEKGQPLWDAVFTLTKGDVTVDRIAEPIMLSHDPNFLKVVSICQASDGGYIVKYHLQFENDGIGPADSLSAILTFPPQFDLSCLTDKEWYAAGLGCKGRIIKNGRVCTFKFREHGQLMSKFKHKDKSYGFVIFTVKVNPPIDVRDVGVSLELTDPTVIFDGVYYKLNLFYDLRKCDHDAAPSPEGLSNITHKNAKENTEKKDKSEKENKEMKSVLLSESVGGAFHCYRPVSPGPCECKGPFWWKWIVGALAIIVIAVIIYRIIRKPPIPPQPPLSPNI